MVFISYTQTSTNMAKRKPELDLANDAEPEKKRKKDSIVMEGLSDYPIELIDFSDVDVRKKYFPDVDLVSSDNIILKYHKCKLADNSIFNQMLNDFEPNDGHCKIELKLFDGRTINLMLNYFEHKEIFVNNCEDTTIVDIIVHMNLHSIAKYAHINDLQKHCENIMQCYQVSNQLIKYYSDNKMDENRLYSTLWEFGIDGILPQDFLLRCFNSAFEKKCLNAVIKM